MPNFDIPYLVQCNCGNSVSVPRVRELNWELFTAQQQCRDLDALKDQLRQEQENIVEFLGEEFVRSMSHAWPPISTPCHIAFDKIAEKIQALAAKIRNQNQRIDNLLNRIREIRRNLS